MASPPLQVEHQALGSKSPDIGRKMGRNLSKDLFFLALHLILGENWNEIWVKTFFLFLFFYFCSSPDFGRKIGRNLSEDLFFLLFTWFWAKNWTKFECDNFKFWSMFLSNFLKFLAPPPFQNPAYATGPRALLYLGHWYPQYQIGLPYYNRSYCSEPNSKLNPQLPHCQVRKDRNARKSLPSHD